MWLTSSPRSQLDEEHQLSYAIKSVLLNLSAFILQGTDIHIGAHGLPICLRNLQKCFQSQEVFAKTPKIWKWKMSLKGQKGSTVQSDGVSVPFRVSKKSHLVSLYVQWLSIDSSKSVYLEFKMCFPVHLNQELGGDYHGGCKADSRYDVVGSGQQNHVRGLEMHFWKLCTQNKAQ